MCRMIVAFGVEPSDRVLDSFVLMSQGISPLGPEEKYGKEKHGDGWGALLKEDGAYKLYKSPHPCWEDKYTGSLNEKETILLHARKATRGKVGEKNTHPFYAYSQGNEWFFCHNGTVRDEFPRYKGVKGETDSERLFHHILSRLEKGNELASIDRVIGELKDYTASNFFLLNKDHLYAGRHCAQDKSSFGLHVFQGKKSVVISSEPFGLSDTGSWSSLKNHTSLKVDLALNKIVEQR